MRNSNNFNKKQIVLTSVLVGMLTANSWLQVSSKELLAKPLQTQTMEWSSNNISEIVDNLKAKEGDPNAFKGTDGAFSFDEYKKTCSELDCKIDPALKMNITETAKLIAAIAEKKSEEEKKLADKNKPTKELSEKEQAKLDKQNELKEFIKNECSELTGSKLRKCEIDAKKKFKEQEEKRIAKEKADEEKQRIADAQKEFKTQMAEIKNNCKSKDSKDQDSQQEQRKCTLEGFAKLISDRDENDNTLDQKFVNAQFNELAKKELSALVYNSNVSPTEVQEVLTSFLGSLPEKYADGKNGLNLVVLNTIKAKATQQANVAAQAYQKALDGKNSKDFTSLFQTADQNRREFNAMSVITNQVLLNSDAMSDENFSTAYKFKYLPDIEKMYNSIINPTGLTADGSLNSNSATSTSTGSRDSRTSQNSAASEATLKAIQDNVQNGQQTITNALNRTSSVPSSTIGTTGNANVITTTGQTLTGVPVKTTDNNGVQIGTPTQSSTVNGKTTGVRVQK